MPKLFTPNTMKDEYHAAFRKAVKGLCYRGDIETILFSLRESEPDIYMELATLAFDYGDNAMRLGARIYFECRGIE